MTQEKDEILGQQGVEAALASLQPIRDLAKNWDIDIATCLEEYLHELVGDLSEEDRHRLATNHESLNFAQAAMVLQNSSNVYSRKVEYLYSLVYKALEGLVSHGQNGASKKSRGKATDKEVEEFFEFDPYQDFLLLDDVLPLDNSDDRLSINLASSEAPTDSNRSIDSLHSLGRSHFSWMERRTCMTAATIDRSLAAMNAVARRATIGSLDNGGLRLVDGKCDIKEDGTLLMPGTASNQDDSNDRRISEVTQPRFSAGNAHPEPGDDGGEFVDPTEDNDDDGVGFVLADDNDVLDGPPPEERSRKRVTFAETLPQQQKQPKKKDPFALLDPHEPDLQKPRPLRKRKTFKLPPGVEDPPSKCVTGAGTRVFRKRKEVPFPEQKSVTSIATETFKASLAARKRRHDESTLSSTNENVPPAVALKGLAFGEEFAYIARATAKRNAAERRERRKQQAEAGTVVPSSVEEEEDGGGFNFYGYDDGDDYGDDGGDFIDSGDGPIETNTGMASVDDAYRNDIENNGAEEGALTFEELCRAHIQAFAKGAEKYASHTQLSRRVNKWQEKLAPLLEEEERRPVFDIHEYSRRVVDIIGEEVERRNLKKKKAAQGTGAVSHKRVDFGLLAKGQSEHEVCRMFMATLMLCNSGNVSVHKSSEGAHSVSIELLSTNMEQPLDTYLAPSVSEVQT